MCTCRRQFSENRQSPGSCHLNVICELQCPLTSRRIPFSLLLGNLHVLYLDIHCSPSDSSVDQLYESMQEIFWHQPSGTGAMHRMFLGTWRQALHRKHSRPHMPQAWQDKRCWLASQCGDALRQSCSAIAAAAEVDAAQQAQLQEVYGQVPLSKHQSAELLLYPIWESKA